MNTKIDRIGRRFVPIMADATGALPTRIEVLRVGSWRTPYHGDFMITPQDLAEYADNFDVAQVEAGIGLPIDFSHDSEDMAAGWIKGLSVEGESLYADPVEWSDAGKAALTGGTFKCFSPCFYPRDFGGWVDPEDENHIVPNVIEGGGLTNIPLFKGLKPVMASTKSDSMGAGNNSKNVIYISANAKKEIDMLLEDVRKKEVSQLSDAEKEFLNTNQAQLTAEEQTKFGLKAEDPAPNPNPNPAPAPAPAPVVDPAPAPAEVPEAVLASVKSGESVVVKASTLKDLQDTAQRFEDKEADQIMDGHIARGAIVADQKPAWSKRLVASKGADRQELEALLSKIPDNQVMASTQGNDAGAGDATEPEAELHKKVTERVTASEGKLSYSDAQKLILNEDKELATAVNAARA